MKTGRRNRARERIGAGGDASVSHVLAYDHKGTGYVQASLFQAPGDIIVGGIGETMLLDGMEYATPTRLPGGTTNQVLTYDSTLNPPAKWAAAGAGSTIATKDEGVAIGSPDTLDFVGSGVTATFAGTTTSVSVPGGAPTTSDYLVGTSDAGLSAEIVYDPLQGNLMRRVSDSETMLMEGIEYSAGITPLSIGADGAYLASDGTDFSWLPSPEGRWGKTADVTTSETTGSATYTDLATVGPSRTFQTGISGMALVILEAEVNNSAGGNATYMSVSIDGATAVDADACGSLVAGNTRTARLILLTGLLSGSHTAVAKYRAAAGTGTFSARRLIVLPL